MTLSGLTIGALTLDPTFSPDEDDYSATTYNATNKVTATPTDENAEITILLNGEEIENESSAEWDEGLNSMVINVANGGNEKSYYVHINYYPEVELTFNPSQLTADSTYGLSSDTVTVQGTDVYTITIDSIEADNEHITGEYSNGIITLTCDDDTIFTEDDMPFTVTVTGKRDNNPAVGTISIVHS